MTNQQKTLCSLIKKEQSHDNMELLATAIKMGIARNNCELQKIFYELYVMGAIVNTQENGDSITMVRGFKLEEQTVETEIVYPLEYANDVNRIVVEIIENTFINKAKREAETITDEEEEDVCMDAIEAIVEINKNINREKAIAISKWMLPIAKSIMDKKGKKAIKYDNKMLVEVIERITSEFEIATDAEYEMLRKQIHGGKK